MNRHFSTHLCIAYFTVDGDDLTADSRRPRHRAQVIFSDSVNGWMLAAYRRKTFSSVLEWISSKCFDVTSVTTRSWILQSKPPTLVTTQSIIPQNTRNRNLNLDRIYAGNLSNTITCQHHHRQHSGDRHASPHHRQGRCIFIRDADVSIKDT